MSAGVVVDDQALLVLGDQDAFPRLRPPNLTSPRAKIVTTHAALIDDDSRAGLRFPLSSRPYTRRRGMPVTASRPASLSFGREVHESRSQHDSRACAKFRTLQSCSRDGCFVFRQLWLSDLERVVVAAAAVQVTLPFGDALSPPGSSVDQPDYLRAPDGVATVISPPDNLVSTRFAH